MEKILGTEIEARSDGSGLFAKCCEAETESGLTENSWCRDDDWAVLGASLRGVVITQSDEPCDR